MRHLSLSKPSIGLASKVAKRKKFFHKNSFVCRFVKENVSPDNTSSTELHHIFTDASVRNNQIGLGAVFVKKCIDVEECDMTTTHASLNHYPVFTPRKKNKKVFKKGDSTFAELLGILFGLKWYKSLPESVSKDKAVNILTDSTPAIWHVSSQESMRYKPLVEEIRHVISGILKCDNCKSVDLYHVQGHRGIYGNEIADRMACKGRKMLCTKEKSKTLRPEVMRLIPGIIANYHGCEKEESYIDDSTWQTQDIDKRVSIKPDVFD